jgi:membrane-associated phospholipid phosphatase
MAVIYFYSNQRFTKFCKSWFPFISLFVLFEFLRSLADKLSPFTQFTLETIYTLESRLFTPIPTIFLQHLIPPHPIMINPLAILYSTFFYYSFLIAFIIWLKKPLSFPFYMRRFLLLSFLSLLVFFLFPTAPPWFVATTHHLNINRHLFDHSILTSLKSFSIYRYLLQINPIAAFPSLHSAWPMFTTIYFTRLFKGRRFLFLYLIPLSIGFTLIYTGEHFLLDVLFGYFLAIIFNLPIKKPHQTSLMRH